MARAVDRSSRMALARGYHPRGRTVGDSPGAVRLPPASTAGTQPVATQPRVVNRRARALGRPDPATGVGARATTTRTGAAGTRPAASIRPRLADQGRRLRLSSTLMLVLFIVIAGRLVQFQLTKAGAYVAAGIKSRTEIVRLPAPRGAILDRFGAVLAGSAEARFVFADPTLVKDPASTADALVPVLGVPRSELLPKLMPHRRDDGTVVAFEYLARGLPVATGDAVSALGLHGVGVRRDESRVVPGHDLAANVIGFTGRDLTGLAGLEASFDGVLRGVDGERRFEIGQRAAAINLDHEIPAGYREETPAKPGSDLVLTIDSDLQFEVQRVLAARLRQAGAVTGAAVVLDVRTGEVLAQASYPLYDAANPFAYQTSDRGDAATGLALDPGSVHKAIVFAACLQEGVVGVGDSVLVGPSVTKGGVRFTDTHDQASPTRMTLAGILALSSNVGTIALADRLGADKLYEYQRAFGLGQPTGVGLLGEAEGDVRPPSEWSGSSYGSIPIGMGVSVTPLQMAAVYATIANGGVWVQPHLVQSVVNQGGVKSPVPLAPSRRVISAENAAALRTLLEGVIRLPGATGRAAAVANFRVAGKTGTGRMVKDGVYQPGEVSSFIGMAPADAPRYVIAVFAQTKGSGAGITAPAFAAMMEYTLQHYRVAPTGSRPPTLRIYP